MKKSTEVETSFVQNAGTIKWIPQPSKHAHTCRKNNVISAKTNVATGDFVFEAKNIDAKKVLSPSSAKKNTKKAKIPPCMDL